MQTTIQTDMLIHAINVEISHQQNIAKRNYELAGTASRQLGIIKGLHIARDLLSKFEVA